MAITNLDQLVAAMAGPASRIVLDKGNLANQVAGRYCSMWRATGQPAQGAIPTTAAVCTNALTGAVQFTQQTAPSESYIGVLDVVGSNSAFTLEVHDRIAHMGGLVLNVTTLQPPTGTLIDLDALAPSADRIGDPSYGDVQWWLEVYADGGATASNATINVTFDDNTSGNLTTLAVGGTIRIGNRFSVDALRTTAQQGKNIKRINTVQLSASTGTAGNFGFTCTRPRAYLPMGLASFGNKADWAALGLPGVPNGSCLELMILPSTTSSGTLRGGGKIIHG
jgi:hypothetical protein